MEGKGVIELVDEVSGLCTHFPIAASQPLLVLFDPPNFGAVSLCHNPALGLTFPI